MALTSPPRTDYVSYLGGTYTETVVGIAVDRAGSEYVAGNTTSPNFPITSTTLGTPTATSGCAFVTKFNAAGTGILLSYCVADSRVLAFGIDGSGNMYLALVQSRGVVMVKVEPAGQRILYSTPIGGSPEAMAVDAPGNVYLAGSADAGVATTAGAYQLQLAAGMCPVGPFGQGPCPDAFAMKLGTTGAVLWATYLGGSGSDGAHAIAVDASGNVWIVGETTSPNFPVTPGALQTAFHGEVDLGPLRFGDAFVSKLDPTGGKLLFSTYLGGSSPDGAFSVAVDAAGAAYVAGGTQSTDFPTTAGVVQGNYSGMQNTPPSLLGAAFVTKFNAAGMVAYSTYLGSGDSIPTAIAVDAAGQAYVNAVGPISKSAACVQAAKVSVLNATASAVAASSPVGGDYLALDSNGGLFSAGLARTLVFFSTPGAYQTQYGGGDSDVFAAKVDFSQPAGAEIFSIVNAASYLAGYPTPFPTGAIAPGEIVTVFGNGFGSKPSVSFNGVPGPVVYGSNCQINAVVPFEEAPGGSTYVSVQGAETIGPVKLQVVAAAPGIFTSTGTGAGQGSIVNQDGTINSALNPAPAGSIVAVYMTGAGTLAPYLADGARGPLSAPFPGPSQGVTATIGFQTATVVFARQAPGLIAGATQINILIPPNSPTGNAVALSIGVGGYVSQYNPAVTLAVK